MFFKILIVFSIYYTYIIFCVGLGIFSNNWLIFDILTDVCEGLGNWWMMMDIVGKI